MKITYELMANLDQVIVCPHIVKDKYEVKVDGKPIGVLTHTQSPNFPSTFTLKFDDPKIEDTSAENIHYFEDAIKRRLGIEESVLA